MNNKLQSIILEKKREVIALEKMIELYPNHLIARLLRGETIRTVQKSFKKILGADGLSIIAEIKRRSPSKGFLAGIPDPLLLAKAYIAGGANALSILTDELFFGGSLHDLTLVAQYLQTSAVPILRKDFVIDHIQIAEAIMAGADAILAIVAVLGEKTIDLSHTAKAMGIEVLVEVHDESELEIALQSDAQLIGINNRNLKTMQINTDTAFQLVEKIPAHIIKVAESGILDPALARAYHQAGFDAVLIGEALVTSNDPKQFIRACCYGNSAD